MITKKRYRDTWNVRDSSGNIKVYNKREDSWKSYSPFYAKTGGVLYIAPKDKTWKVTDKTGKVVTKGQGAEFIKYMRRPENPFYHEPKEELEKHIEGLKEE